MSNCTFIYIVTARILRHEPEMVRDRKSSYCWKSGSTLSSAMNFKRQMFFVAASEKPIVIYVEEKSWLTLEVSECQFSIFVFDFDSP